MYTLLHRSIATVRVIYPLGVSAFSRALHSSPAALGIFDNLRGMAAAKVATNQDVAKKKSFDIQRIFLADSPTYSLLDHQQLLEKLADNAGVKSWKTMLMSDAQKSELAENLVDLKIVGCLTAAEVSGFKPGGAGGGSIDGKAKERVAKELGTDVARVNRFLGNYLQSFAVHQWLQERKGKGLAIPVVQEEFNLCAVQDKVMIRELSLRQSIPPSPCLLLTTANLPPSPAQPPHRRPEAAAGEPRRGAQQHARNAAKTVMRGCVKFSSSFVYASYPVSSCSSSWPSLSNSR
jgi:hypothetical protein